MHGHKCRIVSQRGPLPASMLIDAQASLSFLILRFLRRLNPRFDVLMPCFGPGAGEKSIPEILVLRLDLYLGTLGRSVQLGVSRLGLPFAAVLHVTVNDKPG